MRIGATDWWAVLVELLVVVLGILIAFQLNEWGEQWDARQSERALLQRIEVEARADLVALTQVRDLHIESAANYRTLAHAISDPAAHAAFHRSSRDSCNLLRLPAVRRQAAGALGQAAGERNDLVSDPILRNALRRAEAERAFNDSQLIYFRDNFLRYGQQIEPHMIWSFTSTGDTACQIDIDRLRDDPAAVAMLPKLFRDQRRFAIYRELEIQATKAVTRRVACLRGGSCGKNYRENGPPPLRVQAGEVGAEAPNQ